MDRPSSSSAINLEEWNNVRVEIPAAESEVALKKYTNILKQEVNKFPSELHRVHYNNKSPRAKLIGKHYIQHSMSPFGINSRNQTRSVLSNSIINSKSPRRSNRIQKSPLLPNARILRSTSKTINRTPSPIPQPKRMSNRPTIESPNSSHQSTIDLERESSIQPSNSPKSLNSSTVQNTNSEVPEEDGPLVRLSRRECFSASHRLHNPQLTDEQNREIYGKCNNINGHGHNYVVYVILCGPIDKQTGMVYNLTDLKVEIKEVLDRMDHKNLDLDVKFFKKRTSTVENIAYYIARSLKKKMSTPELLYKVKVCETENNSASICSKDLQ